MIIMHRFNDRISFIALVLVCFICFIASLIILGLSGTYAYDFWLNLSNCLMLEGKEHTQCTMEVLSEKSGMNASLLSIASIVTSLNGAVCSFLAVTLYKVSR